MGVFIWCVMLSTSACTRQTKRDEIDTDRQRRGCMSSSIYGQASVGIACCCLRSTCTGCLTDDATGCSPYSGRPTKSSAAMPPVAAKMSQVRNKRVIELLSVCLAVISFRRLGRVKKNTTSGVHVHIDEGKKKLFEVLTEQYFLQDFKVSYFISFILHLHRGTG